MFATAEPILKPKIERMPEDALRILLNIVREIVVRPEVVMGALVDGGVLLRVDPEDMDRITGPAERTIKSLTLAYCAIARDQNLRIALMPL